MCSSEPKKKEVVLKEVDAEEREKSAAAGGVGGAAADAGASLGNAKTMGELRSGFAKITASLQRENKDAMERAQQEMDEVKRVHAEELAKLNEELAQAHAWDRGAVSGQATAPV